jgi:hypothetical protein
MEGNAERGTGVGNGAFVAGSTRRNAAKYFCQSYRNESSGIGDRKGDMISCLMGFLRVHAGIVHQYMQKPPTIENGSRDVVDHETLVWYGGGVIVRPDVLLHSLTLIACK